MVFNTVNERMHKPSHSLELLPTSAGVKLNDILYIWHVYSFIKYSATNEPLMLVLSLYSFLQTMLSVYERKSSNFRCIITYSQTISEYNSITFQSLKQRLQKCYLCRCNVQRYFGLLYQLGNIPFNQLLNSLEDGNPKTLFIRLREMEKHGLIKRKFILPCFCSLDVLQCLFLFWPSLFTHIICPPFRNS
jgi:hypothetical protein